MAYVEPSTAANRSVDTLKDIRARNGPGSWRVPLAASPRAPATGTPSARPAISRWS